MLKFSKQNNFKIRNANLNDAVFLYKIYNQNILEGNFFSKKKLKFSDHKSWLQKKIKNKNIFICYRIHRVGYVRFDKFQKNCFKVSIARLFTFIGKRILKNENFAITNLIHQAKNKNIKAIKLSDTRDVYRGYMDSKDLVRWLFKILINSKNKYNIYNVGSDEAVTIEKIAKLIGKNYNKPILQSKTKSLLPPQFDWTLYRGSSTFDLFSLCTKKN